MNINHPSLNAQLQFALKVRGSRAPSGSGPPKTAI
jgi:hypothetical protein